MGQSVYRALLRLYPASFRAAYLFSVRGQGVAAAGAAESGGGRPGARRAALR